MKNYLPLFLFVLFLSFEALGQSEVNKTITVELKKDSDFCRDQSDGSKLCEKYFNFNVEKDETFTLELELGDGLTQENLKGLRKEGENGYSAKFEIDNLSTQKFEIDSDQELIFVFEHTETTDDNKIEKYIWRIGVSGKDIYPNNSNFLFVSVIKSIAGNQPESELIDVNFKFNFSSQRFFSLLAIDFDFTQGSSDTSNTSFSNTINEALISFNKSFLSKKQRNNIDKFHRMGFTGLGAKIFNKQLYLGGHIGSLEIGGPFYSSYFFGGYYYNAYGDVVSELNEPGNNFYRHNFYMEFAFSASNADVMVPILKDLRIKVGFMFPIKTKDDMKPTSQDILSRVVMEVPIGGIFKFRAK